MSWEQVLANAATQREMAERVAADKPTSINVFYPELHGPPHAGEFSNTMGSNLLPDVLTSPCVLVDLYDWMQPAELIRRYAVDLEFLLRLRDEGHVAICANVPAQRFEKCEWLHSVLADHRTIFRSIRSPYFFEARTPGFIAKQTELEDRLFRELDRRGEAEVVALGELTRAAEPPKTPRSVAMLLATWVSRCAALGAIDAEETTRGLLRNPEQPMLRLRQSQLWKAAPHTAGLGGDVRVERAKYLTYFSEPLSANELVEDEYIRVQELNEYLIERVLPEARNTVTGEAFWSRLTPVERTSLLSQLRDKRLRASAFRAERALRRRILRSAQGEPWSVGEIAEYADRASATVNELAEGYRDLLSLVQIATPFVVAYAWMYLPQIFPVIALVGASATALKTELIVGLGKEALEGSIGAVQVAHYVNLTSKG